MLFGANHWYDSDSYYFLAYDFAVLATALIAGSQQPAVTYVPVGSATTVTPSGEYEDWAMRVATAPLDDLFALTQTVPNYWR